MAKIEKLLEQARSHLDGGEKVLAAVQGTYEAKMMGEDWTRAGIFMATQTRVVFYAKKMGGYDLESFAYDRISSFEQSKSMMGHSISFFASGNKVHMKWINDPAAMTSFVNTVKSSLNGTRQVLDKIAAAPRLGEIDIAWTAGWHETSDRKLGYFKSGQETPRRWNDAIMQGPHLSVATPVNQQADAKQGRQHLYEKINLDEMPDNFIPRTNYQVAKPYQDYIAGYPKWDGESSSSFFRLAWRRMADSATVRSLHAAILPPGPTHVSLMLSASLPSHIDLAVAAGIWASIPADFFVKAAGLSELNQGVVRRLPHIRDHPLQAQLVLRTLRLNCLVLPYAPLWEELYDSAWQQDSWVPGVGVSHFGRPLLGEIGEHWESGTPLRSAAARRQALVEIDAIVAVMLGISAEELLTIYHTQFPVLQKYEREALYDGAGLQVPTKLAAEYRKKGFLRPADQTVDGITYLEPFASIDRAADLERAHHFFSSAPL